MNHLVRRNLFAAARYLLEVFRAISIQGSRQVGKSTFAGVRVDDRSHVSVSLL